jgi:hypothetical protein
MERVDQVSRALATPPPDPTAPALAAAAAPGELGCADLVAGLRELGVRAGMGLEVHNLKRVRWH